MALLNGVTVAIRSEVLTLGSARAVNLVRRHVVDEDGLGLGLLVDCARAAFLDLDFDLRLAATNNVGH